MEFKSYILLVSVILFWNLVASNTLLKNNAVIHFIDNKYLFYNSYIQSPNFLINYYNYFLRKNVVYKPA